MISSECSNVIKNLRLPLMIMVVFIHSYLADFPNMTRLVFVETLFSKILPIVAVPLFMFISGYLFFSKCKHLSKDIYVQQCKKRIRTLVIPYVIWNSFVILCFAAMHKFTPSIINADFENISNFSFVKVLNCYWRGSGGFPIAYQFWFIRDLILIVIASPIIYWVARRRYFGLIIVLSMFALVKNSYVEMGSYFFAGAYCSLNNIDFTTIKPTMKRLILFLWVVLIVFYMGENNDIIRNLVIISGSISILNLKVLHQRVGRNSKWVKMWSQFSNGAFFLFCLHGIVDLFSCKIITKFICSDSQLMWILLYFCNVVFVISFCLSLYLLLKKMCPKLLNLTTGNR